QRRRGWWEGLAARTPCGRRQHGGRRVGRRGLVQPLDGLRTRVWKSWVIPTEGRSARGGRGNWDECGALGDLALRRTTGETRPGQDKLGDQRDVESNRDRPNVCVPRLRDRAWAFNEQAAALPSGCGERWRGGARASRSGG